MCIKLTIKADLIIENTSGGSSMVFSFSFRAGFAFYCWKWIGSEKELWVLFINFRYLRILSYVFGFLICRKRGRWCLRVGFCAVKDSILYSFSSWDNFELCWWYGIFPGFPGIVSYIFILLIPFSYSGFQQLGDYSLHWHFSQISKFCVSC